MSTPPPPLSSTTSPKCRASTNPLFLSQILDTNPTLHFHLLQLHLIELIRQSRIPEALSFAQSELAPRGEAHPQFLKELERTMALLAFEMPSLLGHSSGKGAAMPEGIASLLDQGQRLRTAEELNKAILTAQSQGKDPKLPGLMRMLAWGESMLAEKGAEFPKCELTRLIVLVCCTDARR